jgi:fructosamine-3-kinase
MSGSYPAILDRLQLGPPVRLTGVAGGCIADARIAQFEDGTEVFVKSGGGERDGMFLKEAAGLRELASAQAIRIPAVLAADDGSLVLEYIRAGARKDDFFSRFGRRFARLHRKRAGRCGFRHDNYIGSTTQPNTPLDGAFEDTSVAGDGSDWPQFFLERRLQFQAELAFENGYGKTLIGLLERGRPGIEDLLGESTEPPALLHGDLWSGNFIVDELGDACLIDPAVYYGHREADLAMTHLFGGFGPDFYRAYEEEYPLAPGHSERRPLYQLYHLLNHLNLFGMSYYAQCERILRNYVR